MPKLPSEPWCTKSEARIAALLRILAGCAARGGRIPTVVFDWIRNRRATQPPAHFHRNPLGRSQLAVFPRCSLLTYRFKIRSRNRHSGSDRREKQPTDLRRNICLFRGQDINTQSRLRRLRMRTATSSSKDRPITETVPKFLNFAPFGTALKCCLSLAASSPIDDESLKILDYVALICVGGGDHLGNKLCRERKSY
jgi:hypothetical protein